MKLFLILTFIYFTANCVAFRIDQDFDKQEQFLLLQHENQMIASNKLFQENTERLRRHSLVTDNRVNMKNLQEQRASRERRQLEDTPSPVLESTTISISTENVALTPSPPSNSPTEGGQQQYYTVNIPIPSFGSGGSEGFKQTLGNVNNVVQEFGSKVASTVTEFVSSVGRMVSGFMSGDKDKPPQ